MRADGSGLVRLTNDGTEKGARVAWSPDGTKIAFHAYRDSTADIFIVNTDGTNPRALTTHPANDRFPIWSPDGTRIAFASTREVDDEIWLMNADGTHLARLTRSPGVDIPDAWHR